MSPEFRAKGIGKQMVGLLANQITSPIRAEVKSGNLASSRIAKASGMKLEYEKDGILYYFRVHNCWKIAHYVEGQAE